MPPMSRMIETMTPAPTAGPYCSMSCDGIVEMRFSTMVTRSDLRVEVGRISSAIKAISREGLFHSHRGFSPVLR
jgi:hypothetical protein